MGSIIASLGTMGMWTFLLSGTTLLALLVWKVAGAFRREEQSAIVVGATFEDVLRGRLERGEISDREFENVMRQLRDS